MLVRVEDLKEGDEVLIPAGSKLIYARVLRTPHLKFKKDATGAKIPVVNYLSKKQQYSAVPCSVRLEIRKHMNNQNVCSWEEKIYLLSPYDHNSDQYFSLNYVSMWKLDNNIEAVNTYMQYKKSLKEKI